MRNLALLSLLFLALNLSACGDGNSDAPSDRAAHPSGWFTMHADEALNNAGYTECVGCHGADLTGSGDAVSCYSCHAYNTAPPFSVHPTSWSDAYNDHRADAASNGFASCAGCHGHDLRGRDPVPSCYTDSFGGRSCHAEGPSEVPHALDGSYRRGSSHGPDAKFDLTACQACHGELGGPGSNPRFNIGFGENACEDCHTANYAHPQAWAGPNRSFHYTADNLDKACTLCHGVNLDGETGGGIGVSCLGCHDSVTTFTLDCTFCHGYPPIDDLPAPPDLPLTVDHRDVSDVGLHVECFICHGMYETADGGRFEPASNYLLFDYDNDINGYHWDGNIDMSADYKYNPDNYGCDAASCHPNSPAFQLYDSGLPVMLRTFFGGN